MKTCQKVTFVTRRMGQFSTLVCYWIQVGFLVELLCSYYLLIRLYKADGNVVAIVFSVVSSLSELGVWVTIWRVLWLKRDLALDLLTSLSKLTLPHASVRCNARIYQATLLIVVVTSIKLVGGMISIQHTEAWRVLTAAIVSTVQFVTGGISSDLGCVILENTVLAWVFIVMRLSSVFHTYLVVAAFVVNMVAQHFAENLTETKSTEYVIRSLEELKQLNEKINALFGNTFAFHFISTITNHAGIPAYLRNSDGLQWKFCYKGIYAIIHVMVWMWSCEFHRKVQVSLRKWIYRRKGNRTLTLLEATQLNLVAMEVENDPVAISCLCFTVTYELAVSV